MIKSDYQEQFNKIKVVCMMEIAPLTDTFEPIMLTVEQRKKVLDIIASFTDKMAEGFVVITDGDFRTKIPDVRDVYDIQEIKQS